MVFRRADVPIKYYHNIGDYEIRIKTRYITFEIPQSAAIILTRKPPNLHR